MRGAAPRVSAACVVLRILLLHLVLSVCVAGVGAVTLNLDPLPAPATGVAAAAAGPYVLLACGNTYGFTEKLSDAIPMDAHRSLFLVKLPQNMLF